MLSLFSRMSPSVRSRAVFVLVFSFVVATVSTFAGSGAAYAAAPVAPPAVTQINDFTSWVRVTRGSVGDATSYKFQIEKFSGGTWSVVAASGNVTSTIWDVSGLTSGQHRASVRAQNADGNSAYSTPLEFPIPFVVNPVVPPTPTPTVTATVTAPPTVTEIDSTQYGVISFGVGILVFLGAATFVASWRS